MQVKLTSFFLELFHWFSLGFSRFFAPMGGPKMDPFGCPSWRGFRGVLGGVLGGFLGRLGVDLGRMRGLSWGRLGLSCVLSFWGRLGAVWWASWGRFGVSWGRPGGVLGSFWGG